MERRPPLAEPACRTRARVAAVAAHWVLVAVAGGGGGVGGGVDAVVAVVVCALGGVAEDVVGGGDAGEALARGWVAAVAVWMVAH